MTFATTAIEIGRPKGWAGEPFEPRLLLDEHELDHFVVEVEGQVNFWTDNYGADADGNRGVEMMGTDIEDLEFTLYGDFRPFYIKVRDYFMLKCLNRGREGACRYKWSQFSNYDYIRLDEKLFSETEIEEAGEGLERDAEDHEDNFDEDAYYERKREER